MVTRKLSDIQSQEIKELYLSNNMTVQQLSDQFDVSKSTIVRTLRRLKTPLRGPKPVGLTKNGLISQNLYHDYVDLQLGETQLAKKYGVSRDTIHRRLIEFEIPTRDRHESKRLNGGKR